jgi:glycopeptide antibiotics resistance protein
MIFTPHIQSAFYLPRIISFYDQKKEIFSVCQWKSGVVIRILDQKTNKTCEISHSNCLQSKKPATIIFSTSLQNTKLSINNKIINTKKFTSLQKTFYLNGLIILGNSASGNKPWNGKLQELIILPQQLSKKEIKTNSKYLNERNNFKNPQDRIIRLSSILKNNPTTKQTQYQVIIPRIFSPIKKMILTPPWIEFKWKKRYLIDLVLNYLGFIPSGFFLGLLLKIKQTKQRHAVGISLITALIMSSSIELLQTLLPSRTSQLSDVILNTAGSITGTLLCYVNNNALKHITACRFLNKHFKSIF